MNFLRLGKHERTPFQRIARSNFWLYLLMGAILLMPMWIPLTGWV